MANSTIFTLFPPHREMLVTKALGKIGDARAIEPLIRAMKYSEREAAEALAKVRKRNPQVPLWNAAAEALVIALKSSNKYVRRNAVKALGEIGDARAVGPLLALLSDIDRGLFLSNDDFGLLLESLEILKVFKGAIGAQAVAPLIEMFIKRAKTDKDAHDNFTITKLVIDLLERVLETNAKREITPENLRAIIAFEDKDYRWRISPACGDSIAVEENIYCARVRQLARQELIRRGLIDAF